MERSELPSNTWISPSPDKRKPPQPGREKHTSGSESPASLRASESPASLRASESPASLRASESPASLRASESPASLRASESPARRRSSRAPSSLRSSVAPASLRASLSPPSARSLHPQCTTAFSATTRGNPWRSASARSEASDVSRPTIEHEPSGDAAGGAQPTRQANQSARHVLIGVAGPRARGSSRTTTWLLQRWTSSPLAHRPR